MENNVKLVKYQLSQNDSRLDSLVEEPEISSFASEINNTRDEPLQLSSLAKEGKTTIEDSGVFLGKLFTEKTTILNEKWDVSVNIQAKVVHFTSSEVYVDCLIDSENKTFEHRAFPIGLFAHIKLIRNTPVIIKTKLKPGSVRIDVYPGEGMVNLSLFELQDGWKSLEEAKLDDKLTKW